MRFFEGTEKILQCLPYGKILDAFKGIFCDPNILFYSTNAWTYTHNAYFTIQIPFDFGLALKVPGPTLRKMNFL